jgi:VIT1/CCC1 family predicted Fe2+/Mn2+ transporter
MRLTTTYWSRASRD